MHEGIHINPDHEKSILKIQFYKMNKGNKIIKQQGQAANLHGLKEFNTGQSIENV